MILELHFVTFIRNFFGHCHLTFPYKKILPFFSHCHVTFLYMEPLSIFGSFVQKVIVSCFPDAFNQKRRNNQTAVVMLQVNPSFYTNYSKISHSTSPNTYEKYIVSKEFCIARHDDKMCFLHNCRYHILLIGIIKGLLQKKNAFCFYYQHMDCLYTFFKPHFSGKIFVESVQLFDSVQRAAHFNHQNRGVDRMPSIAKKRLLRKKYKKPLLSSFQKTKLTQTSGSVFADRIEQIEKNKFKLEPIKIIDCVLDGHGKHTSNLVSSKKKFL